MARIRNKLKTRCRGHSKYVRIVYLIVPIFFGGGALPPPQTLPLGLRPKPRVFIPDLNHIGLSIHCENGIFENLDENSKSKKVTKCDKIWKK